MECWFRLYEVLGWIIYVLIYGILFKVFNGGTDYICIYVMESI